MGAVLFKLFGFGVTGKGLAYAGGAIILAVLLYLAYDKVNDHFQHIRDVEASNAQLTKDKQILDGQLADAVKINKENARTTKTIIEQRDAAVELANQEQQTTIVRVTKYKEIKDGIQAAPTASTPVAPVVADTLDQLWGQAEGRADPARDH